MRPKPVLTIFAIEGEADRAVAHRAPVLRSSTCYGGWKGGVYRAVAGKSEGGLAMVQFCSDTPQRVRGQGSFIRLWACPPEPWRRSCPAGLRKASSSPDSASNPFQIRCSEFLAQLSGRGEHVEIGSFPVIEGFGLSLGKPPSVGTAYYPFVNSISEVGNLGYGTEPCFDNNLITLFNTTLCGSLRMNLDLGIRPFFPQSFDPPV